MKMAGFFGFFDYSKPGKGVSKDDVQKEGLALYFDILGRRIWKFITLNLIYLLFSIPSIAVIWFISSYGVAWLASIAEMDIIKVSSELFLIGALLSAILVSVYGTGAASAGMAYVIRNFVRDTHSWVWSDFKDNFKSNFFQATAVFIIDMIVIILCFVSLLFYRIQMTGLMSYVLSSVITVVFALFTMMHLYIYPIMVTFKLKTKDLYKNALLIVLARLPWNILVTAVSAVLIYGVVYFAASSIIGIAFLVLVFIPILVYTQMFMTNPVIEKMLLKPALENSPKEEVSEDAVFNDEVNKKEQE